MTAYRIALNTLNKIILRASNEYGYHSRVKHITESALRELVYGAKKYVINLSSREIAALEELGFSIETILPEARGKKDLCGIMIR